MTGLKSDDDGIKSDDDVKSDDHDYTSSIIPAIASGSSGAGDPSHCNTSSTTIFRGSHQKDRKKTKHNPSNEVADVIVIDENETSHYRYVICIYRSLNLHFLSIVST